MNNVYAALLLHKLGKEISEDNLKSVVKAAGGDTDESQIKSLVASLKGVDIDKELENASLVAAAPVSGSAPKEEKKAAQIEEKKEAAAEGLSALFG
ncbi:50S ribosomal protein L12 [Candidatus Pacearchaeota archaeon]|nr:50S ribosomal protein L12 [Candidatus Pacearchaeota archaeon]